MIDPMAQTLTIIMNVVVEEKVSIIRAQCARVLGADGPPLEELGERVRSVRLANERWEDVQLDGVSIVRIWDPVVEWVADRGVTRLHLTFKHEQLP